MGKSIDIATSNAMPPDGVPRYAYTYGGHKFLKTTELAGENPETRLYLGGAEFVDGQPESYYHGEGRVALTGVKPAFQYKLTDHLGNTMVLFEDKDDDKIITTESMSTDPALVEVLQRNFYYAFGLPMQGPWNHAPADPAMPYLYNGKELAGELGLGWYAYGFRYYDASVGRFVGVDPLAGEMPDWSIYSYTFNNPIRLVDPDGRAPESVDGDYYDRQGNYLGNDGIDDNRIYLVNDGTTAEDLGLNSSQFMGFLYSEARAQNTTEVGGLMIMTRNAEGDDFTSGEMSMIGRNGTDNVFTLEPGGPETTTPNQDRRIPDGVYNVDGYSSTRYPDNFILSNDDVSQDRRILIHAGNTGANTAGCILPGCGSGTGRVNDSRTGMQAIRDFINSNNTSVIDRRDDIRMIIRTNINN